MKTFAGVRSLVSTLLLLTVFVGLQGCSKSSSNPAPAIADASAQSYIEATTITTFSLTNSGGGALTSCSSSPALPTGLSIAVSSNASTCEISGAATTPQASSNYTVTATNATGSNTATVPITVTVIADQNAAGYFTGSAAVKTDGDNTLDFSVTDLQIMISGTRIMMMSDAQALLYDGTFTIAGNDLTSTVTIYHNGNKMAATAVLTATVSEGSQITGTFTGTELGNGTFVSTFSNLSNTASALSQVNNNFWLTGLNETPGDGFEFELRSTSTLFESSVPNNLTFRSCRTLAGSTYAPIANSSLFAVTIVFGSCTTPAVDGTYTGFSQALTTTSLAMTVSNGTYAFADDFIQN